MRLVVFILLMVALNGVASVAISAFIRSMTLTIIASSLVTEMLVAIYILNRAKDSPDAADGILASNVIAILSTPVIVCTSIGFVYCWRRWRYRHSV